MRSTKIQDEWPWIVNSDPCCWKMDVPPKAVLSLFFHYLMVPLGLSGRNNRLPKESHHLDVKRRCVPCSMSKIFNLTVRLCRKQTGPKLHLLWRKRNPLPWEQKSFSNNTNQGSGRPTTVQKQYNMMFLIYLQALQLCRMLVRAATRITEAFEPRLVSLKHSTIYTVV
ncbi:hypothetical protein IV203_025502 [Nitzschia inconspicua]|uniref:Uncharacterized protein n=1 Tax=Nitzschia inconspicua TaxID=303405 RepID=A0A9K3KAA9_9STRA|nr:hypothetical protein IV203_028279 [Nitzschia inconspicua]KAG7362618.1 hypothetical protein IV203_025502 [Nitzschia inconspicua]